MATSLEHKFARDIIRFVLYERMLGLFWTPTDIFMEQDIDSPFTPEFKYAVERELDYNGHNIHLLYDLDFPDKSIVQSKHKFICWHLKFDFIRNYSMRCFIKFCTYLANYAGFSYLYGAKNAPYETYILLVICIQELKLLGKIDDDFWNAMQNWLEGEEIKQDGYDNQNVKQDISDVKSRKENELECSTEDAIEDKTC